MEQTMVTEKQEKDFIKIPIYWSKQKRKIVIDQECMMEDFTTEMLKVVKNPKEYITEG